MESTNQDNARTENRTAELEFEHLFKTLFQSLHLYAWSILRNETDAEEIVQQVFLKTWDRRNELDINASLSPYLYRSVHNESLNFLKHRKIKLGFKEKMMTRNQETETATDLIDKKHLEIKLIKALNDLPENCRTVFQLSRFENLKYREIAGKLNISIKTVENHMNKALKKLRISLDEFFIIFIFLFFNK